MSIAKEMPTQAELCELFEYREGKIFWRKSGHGVTIGQEAGCLNGDGYRRVRVNGKKYCTHRIIWVMLRGEIPEGQEIDHRFGHRDDNRVENLRLATSEENHRNRKTPSTNTSGHKGVTWHKARGKWQAQIQVNRKNIHLGYFVLLEEAVAAYEAAAEKYFKDYRRC